MDAYTSFKRQWLPQIDDALAECLQCDASMILRLQEAMRYSALSEGKRVRPLLCLMSADACGSNPDRAIPVACAIEMIHVFSLIHDDLPCMDDDDMRRGKPTNHKVYGEAMALLAGDGLLAHAFDVILTADLPADVALSCAQELSLATKGMIEGQAMDMEPVPAVDIEGIDRLHERKTGKLIVCAARMGAVVAGASSAQVDALTAYGAKLGLAFQITDDVIDAVGESSKAGKAVGKDANRAKKTYPSILGVEQSKKRASQLLADAVSDLGVFDTKADPLRSLAGSILERSR